MLKILSFLDNQNCPPLTLSKGSRTDEQIAQHQFKYGGVVIWRNKKKREREQSCSIDLAAVPWHYGFYPTPWNGWWVMKATKAARLQYLTHLPAYNLLNIDSSKLLVAPADIPIPIPPTVLRINSKLDLDLLFDRPDLTWRLFSTTRERGRRKLWGGRGKGWGWGRAGGWMHKQPND